MNQQKEEAGVKHDAGKLRYDLLPVDALEKLVEVYTQGAVKYGDYNWSKGMSWGRVYGATQRHLNKFWGGEDLDQESGLPHLAHAAWGCMALLAYFLRSAGADDRAVEQVEYVIRGGKGQYIHLQNRVDNDAKPNA